MRNYYICHRLPERTFKIRGHYFPVCARCTGIYFGMFLGYLVIAFTDLQYNFILVVISTLMIIPTFSDGITQFIYSRESNNTLRVTTGLIAGVGLIVLIKCIKLALGIKWGLLT
ncbi:MAG: DUF2085 domain-containing protein [Methanobacterium sp.]